MNKLFFTLILLVSISITSVAQSRKPAMARKSVKKVKVEAPGYIKNTPSNSQQDKMLKQLEREEKKRYAPKKKPQPKPKSKSSKSSGSVTRER